MATVNKDFKIKNGLIVEGTTATINNFDILTKSQAGQDYILNLTGGATLVKSVDTGVFNVDLAGNLTVNAETFDSYGSASAAQSAAEATASADATSKANAAQAAAEATASADATSKANAAQAAAATTAAGLIAAITPSSLGLGNVDNTSDVNKPVSTATQAALDLKTNASNPTISGSLTLDGSGDFTISSDSNIVLDPTTTAYVGSAALGNEIATQGYVDGLASNYDAAGAAATAETNAATYTDTAVANLVDGAPELLDTLNELAAALSDSPDTVTNLATEVGLKAYSTDVATDISTAVSTASADATSKANAAQAAAISTASADATSKANAALTSAQSYADTAELDAINSSNSYTDNLLGDVTVDGTSGNTVKDRIDTKADATNATISGSLALDGTGDFTITSDSNIILDATTTSYLGSAVSGNEIATQQYVDDAAANVTIDLSTAAGDHITWDEVGETFNVDPASVAAELTTTDLVEGSNLYFTDVRAVDALEAVVPNFTAVEINSVAKQVAATLSAPTAGVQTAHAFAKADYRSAEYLVKVAYGTHTEISKVLLTLDTSDNISITEYGIVGTNGSASAISAGISGTDVQLLVTTANNNSTVTVMGTLLV